MNTAAGASFAARTLLGSASSAFSTPQRGPSIMNTASSARFVASTVLANRGIGFNPDPSCFSIDDDPSHSRPSTASPYTQPNQKWSRFNFGDSPV